MRYLAIMYKYENEMEYLLLPFCLRNVSLSQTFGIHNYPILEKYMQDKELVKHN